MSEESLVDRVLAAKADAMSVFANHVAQGGALSEAQQAEILIAQVQAVLGTYEPRPASEPEPEPEPAAEEKTETEA